MNFRDFIEQKSQLGSDTGFAPHWMPDFAFDFQQALLDWIIRKGRGAIFADCGMGKTPMQLTVAENVVRETNRPFLIIAPLAVSSQTVREAAKFGIDAQRSRDGEPRGNITVTNYEMLHKFSPGDFAGVACDESSILKSFDGTLRNEITQFMRRVPYRSLWTATAAPNDYVELGTSSEALGYLGHIDMLNRFFTNNRNNSAVKQGRMYGQVDEWRFKGHAEAKFWRWVTSWARAVRRPSDLGFDDGDFILPPLIENEHMVDVETPPPGALFTMPATTLPEQRDERKRTITERCERAASLVNDTGKPALVWCHMNPEGDLLEKLIPDAVQVSGRDSDDAKEEKLLAFQDGKARVLITKPIIGAWGLNFQHCAHIVYFPSHSYEQYYQAVRRCWRFGQKSPVAVDVILTEGELRVRENLRRKAVAADTMFNNLVECMNDSLGIKKINNFTKAEALPSWL